MSGQDVQLITAFNSNNHAYHRFQGDVEISCDVPKGAAIKVIDGSLTFKKGVKIGDDVQIEVKSKGNNNSIGDVSVSGSNISISGSSSGNIVIVNGKVITQSGSSQSSSGDVIFESCQIGRKVLVEASGSIKAINSKIGDHFQGDAKGSIKLESSVGKSANLDAGGSISFDVLGDGAVLDAGGSINGQKVGVESEINAGGSIGIIDVLDASNLDAGGSIRVERAYVDVCLDAGGSIKVETADPSVTMDGGGSVRCKNKIALSAATEAKPEAETKAEVKKKAELPLKNDGVWTALRNKNQTPKR